MGFGELESWRVGEIWLRRWRVGNVGLMGLGFYLIYLRESWLAGIGWDLVCGDWRLGLGLVWMC